MKANRVPVTLQERKTIAKRETNDWAQLHGAKAELMTPTINQDEPLTPRGIMTGSPVNLLQARYAWNRPQPTTGAVDETTHRAGSYRERGGYTTESRSPEEDGERVAVNAVAVARSFSEMTKDDVRESEPTQMELVEADDPYIDRKSVV